MVTHSLIDATIPYERLTITDIFPNKSSSIHLDNLDKICELLTEEYMPERIQNFKTSVLSKYRPWNFGGQDHKGVSARKPSCRWLITAYIVWFTCKSGWGDLVQAGNQPRGCGQICKFPIIPCTLDMNLIRILAPFALP
jgi:hypothetical protein